MSNGSGETGRSFFDAKAVEKLLSSRVVPRTVLDMVTTVERRWIRGKPPGRGNTARQRSPGAAR